MGTQPFFLGRQPIIGRQGELVAYELLFRDSADNLAVVGNDVTASAHVIQHVFADLGVQAALISNQAFVYALQPDARSRINTVFMCVMFLGGALGSLLSGIAWHLAGWEAVVMVGAALPAIGLAIHMMRRK